METLKALAKELANTSNSDDRWIELTPSQKEFCKAHDIVVVYGYSDDNVEFDGAIREEVGAWEGATISVTADGPMEGCDCECKYSKAALMTAKKIIAFWCRSEWCWEFETDIPHEEFEFWSDGEPFCKGIVFYKKDMA
jgi:hypothetical protein